MASEFQRRTDTRVVVLALGLFAVTELHVRRVLETVELQDAVKVVTTRLIQPCGVGTRVVAVDSTAGAVAQVQIGFAVPAKQAHQPLTVTEWQRRIDTERQASLGLLVGRAGTGIDIKLVAISTHPATRLAAVLTYFTHAAAQGAEFAVPDSRRSVEQGHHRLGARADNAGRRVEKPFVIALLDQVVGKSALLHRAVEQ
ncbi:hypothetical protein D3C71_1249710 [compost metagenome]